MAKKRHDAPDGYIDLFVPVKLAALITQLVDEYPKVVAAMDKALEEDGDIDCLPVGIVMEIGQQIIQNWRLVKEASGLVVPPPPAKKGK